MEAQSPDNQDQRNGHHDRKTLTYDIDFQGRHSIKHILHGIDVGRTTDTEVKSKSDSNITSAAPSLYTGTLHGLGNGNDKNIREVKVVSETKDNSRRRKKTRLSQDAKGSLPEKSPKMCCSLDTQEDYRDTATGLDPTVNFLYDGNWLAIRESASKQVGQCVLLPNDDPSYKGSAISEVICRDSTGVSNFTDSITFTSPSSTASKVRSSRLPKRLCTPTRSTSCNLDQKCPSFEIPDKYSTVSQELLKFHVQPRRHSDDTIYFKEENDTPDGNFHESLSNRYPRKKMDDEHGHAVQPFDLQKQQRRHIFQLDAHCLEDLKSKIVHGVDEQNSATYFPFPIHDRKLELQKQLYFRATEREAKWPEYPLLYQESQNSKPNESRRRRKSLVDLDLHEVTSQPLSPKTSKAVEDVDRNQKVPRTPSWNDLLPDFKGLCETSAPARKAREHDDQSAEVWRDGQEVKATTSTLASADGMSLGEGSLMQDTSTRKYRVDETAYDNLTMSKSGVKVTLLNSSLWKAFSGVGTEMIINRGGRRMFPYLAISVNGLVSDALYSVSLEILPTSTRRFKYINSKWMPVGLADIEPVQAPFFHPDSPNTGSHFCKIKIIFSKIKLTNNKDSAEGNILLHSMHKYRIVVTFKPVDTKPNQSSPDGTLTFSFPETDFIAVTAYQNEAVTQMKIHNNPFAKAFRDASFTTVRRYMASRRRKHHLTSGRSGQKNPTSYSMKSAKRLVTTTLSEMVPTLPASSVLSSPSLSLASSLMPGSGYWPLVPQEGTNAQETAVHPLGLPYLMPWMGIYPPLLHSSLYSSLFPSAAPTSTSNDVSNEGRVKRDHTNHARELTSSPRSCPSEKQGERTSKADN